MTELLQSRKNWLRDLIPVERGLWSAIKSVLMRPGEFVCRRHEGDSGAAKPIQMYLFSAAVAFGVTRLVGEHYTGALFAAGGGVFGKLGSAGPWVAFLLTVPILSIGLLAAFLKSPKNRFAKHVDFSLVFQAVVFLLVTVEAIWIRVLDGLPGLRSVGSWIFLAVAAVYFVVALGTAYRESLVAAFSRSLVVAIVYGSAMAAAVVILAKTVGFTL